MKTGHNNTSTSRFDWLIAGLFLLLISYGQSSRLYHHHHALNEVVLAFPAGAPPLATDLEHTADHHHHDEEQTHTDSHQHSFENLIDWHFVRNQDARRISLDNQLAIPLVSYILTEDSSPTCLTGEDSVFSDQYDLASWLIRGPPQLA